MTTTQIARRQPSVLTRVCAAIMLGLVAAYIAGLLPSLVPTQFRFKGTGLPEFVSQLVNWMAGLTVYLGGGSALLLAAERLNRDKTD